MSAYSYPLIIKQLLITPLRLFAKQEIIYRDGPRLTFRDFGERVGRLGSALSGLGVAPGETVAVMDWDSHRYLECFFAIPMLGCVLQTLNIRLSPDQVLYTLNHTRARTILCNTDFLPLLQALKPRLDHARRFVCIDDHGRAPEDFDWAGEYEALLAAGDSAHAFPDFDENTQATTFYTTGTTGLPKGVFYSHRQIVLHTLTLMGTVPITQRDVYMPITPMFHVHAWGQPYCAVLRGMKQIYPGRYQPEKLVEWFVREKVTYSHCVPTIMRMFLAAADGVDLRGWKVVIGGSALPRTLAQCLLDRGVDVFAGYGMSETGPIATLSLLPPELRDGGETELTYRCRAGRPAALVDLRIQDGEGNFLPHDGRSAGEVVMRSPWLTAGYTGDPAASAALWAGGWLHTGDIGTIDNHGFLQITDRIKDVVKTGGEWVSSLDVEDIVATHPDVAEVAVIGVKDAAWGERPMAIIVLQPDRTGDVASIKSHIMRAVEAGHISKYALPDRIEFAAEIPKTSVGKLDKKVLRQ
ncbi:MAG TPA: fatty acid--CoA ligase, partial [Acetobacteraceae bacterium]|nr:fatty acid--CoA ligase [Acetobacteraceae bacterium]